MGCAVLLSSSSSAVHDRAACKRHNAAFRSLWWGFEFPFKHPMDSPQQLELALWEVEQTVLSKHISLWTPLSTESWGAEIGCNHVDRWLTFYCSAKPNLQGWWWIQNVWNDAIPQILWLSHGAALQCSLCQSTGLSNVYVTCTCRHTWHAQTSGNAKKMEDVQYKQAILIVQLHNTCTRWKNNTVLVLFCLMPANTIHTLLLCPIDLTEWAGSWQRTQILPGVAP